MNPITMQPHPLDGARYHALHPIILRDLKEARAAAGRKGWQTRRARAAAAKRQRKAKRE